MKVDILERLDLSKGFGHVLKFEPVFFHKTISIALWDKAIYNNGFFRNGFSRRNTNYSRQKLLSLFGLARAKWQNPSGAI
jgi:hypothetical protein